MRETRTVVQKIFDAHRIQDEGGRSLLYIDRELSNTRYMNKC